MGSTRCDLHALREIRAVNYASLTQRREDRKGEASRGASSCGSVVCVAFVGTVDLTCVPFRIDGLMSAFLTERAESLMRATNWSASIKCLALCCAFGLCWLPCRSRLLNRLRPKVQGAVQREARARQRGVFADSDAGRRGYCRLRYVDELDSADD